MGNKLVPLQVKSIYKVAGGWLPGIAAQMTPDAAVALIAVRTDIEKAGGCFRVSDMYRSSAMQARAHQDYVSGRKKAYSPPAGGSMHEAGRAIDLDLAALITPGVVPEGFKVFDENEIRAIFEKHGWTFISAVGNPHLVDVKESWHIEFRGKFQGIYNANLGRGHKFAYTSMAKAAIADLSAGDGAGVVATGNVAAQPKLAKLGYLKAEQVDGHDGPVTQGAIKIFQFEHKLKVDGSAGPGTHAELDKAIAALPK